ncbi:MAG: glycosyltransferase family 4 protein [Rhodopila sp.]|jgi:glycosyltransferase involved in cell wall biosynthesis
MKVAIVHEWLETYAGSERVLEQMISCYPNADIFAVVDFLSPQERGFLQGRDVVTSFIQRLPFAGRYFRSYLPLMPAAVEQFDLSGYDLVLSSSHAVAKGVLTGPNQVHVSYVHSPMRYAWDQQAQYLRQAGLTKGLKTICAKAILHELRMWDVRTANGVDQFVANSSFIAGRIRKVYRRNSIVLHPPVDTDAFCVGDRRDDFYVLAARFVPYKRVDLVVEAFRQMPDRQLRVIGTGPELRRVRQVARGTPNIGLLDPLPRGDLIATLQNARAFVFAGEEDFGITMVEAQACGTPVIAYCSGGAVDIVRSGVTGILFREQTAAAIVDAVQRFEALETEITPQNCRTNAERFSVSNFRRGLTSAVEAAMNVDHARQFLTPEFSFA